MKKKYLNRMALALVFTCSIGLFTSCTKNEVDNSTASDISSVTTVPDFDVEAQAALLTRHIMMGARVMPDVPTIETDNVDGFIIRTVSFVDEDYLYNGVVYKEDDGYWVFPLHKVQQMVYEVFGIEDARLTANGSAVIFDEEKQSYFSGLEFGSGSGYDIENTEVVLTETAEVVVLFDLYAIMDEERDFGRYSITYRVMQEEGRTFLRFEKMEKL